MNVFAALAALATAVIVFAAAGVGLAAVLERRPKVRVVVVRDSARCYRWQIRADRDRSCLAVSAKAWRTPAGAQEDARRWFKGRDIGAMSERPGGV